MDRERRPRLLKRGGARNRRNRESWQLSENDCQKLIGASAGAFAAGKPLNRFVTLAWGKGGIDAEGSVVATGDFVKFARDWLAARDQSMPWAWVQERGGRFGQHCHLLLQVPPELDELFRPMPLRWVKAILPDIYVAGTFQSQKLGTALSAQNNPFAYEAELLGKVHYMLKCAPERLEGPLELVGWGRKPWGNQAAYMASVLAFGRDGRGRVNPWGDRTGHRSVSAAL